MYVARSPARRNYFFLSSLILALLSCGPADPPPPGFVQACYGGDFKKYLDGTVPQRMIVVKAGESDWRRLATDLTAAGRTLGLEVFDTSATKDFVRTIGVHLCSSDGLWISADQRIWTGENADAANQHRDFGEVPITIHGYKSDSEWARKGDELARMLASSWHVLERDPASRAMRAPNDRVPNLQLTGGGGLR